MDEFDFERVAAVVFDLGGVFLEGGPSMVKSFGPRHGLDQEPWDELRRELFIDGDAWDRVERAESTLEEFATMLKARVAGYGVEITMAQARNFMRDPGSEEGMPLRPEIVAVCSNLFKLMPVALLTNNIDEWRKDWRARFDLPNLFDVVIDSSQVGMRKPEPRIYELTERKLGLSGPQILFVDDIGGNLKAGKARGWQTLKFVESRHVVAQLNRLAEGRSPRR